MKTRFVTALGTCALVAATACAAPRYVPPNLPGNQLAVVQTEDRATVLSVDGLKPGRRGEPESERMFAVGPGCREIVAKYEESFTKAGKSDAMFTGSAITDAVVQGVQAAGSTEVHHYSTDKPIHFFVNAKGGRAYWVTSSFNGSQFYPRVAEIDPVSNETVGEITPDMKCP